MATVDTLPPDQRAVLALLVHQRMSYADIATMLKLSDAAVRERAHGALAAIGPRDTELTARRRAEIGDWLLRQDSGDEREETEALLRRSGAAREWARAVAGELRSLGGDGPPEVPGGGAAAEPRAAAAEAPPPAAPASPAAGAVLAADPTAPPAAPSAAATAAAAALPATDQPAAAARTAEAEAAVTRDAAPANAAGRDAVESDTARRDAAESDTATRDAGDSDAGATRGASDGDAASPRRSSRAGGALLLAGIALVAVVLVVLLTGGDDDGGSGGRSTQPATRTATQDATPRVIAQVNLRPPRDSPSPRALGVVQIVRVNNQQAINAVFDGLPKPAGRNVGYGIWLWSTPRKRKWLGFLSTADEQGRLVAQGRFDEQITAYRELLLTRENRRDPPGPGTIYLRGRVQRAPR
jgi:hypothetical protein